MVSSANGRKEHWDSHLTLVEFAINESTSALGDAGLYALRLLRWLIRTGLGAQILAHPWHIPSGPGSAP